MAARATPAPAVSRPDAAAGFGRRVAAMVYETIVVAAVVFVASLLFQGAATGRLEGATRLAFQIYLATVLGLYFAWFWQRGQTLPMRAWRLRLVARGGGRVAPGRALVRYLAAALPIGTSLAAALYLREHPGSAAAWAALAPGPVSIAWAAFDRDRQALYDRIAGTRLVTAFPPTTSSPGQ